MKKYTRLKLACYTSNISMSIVSALPPLLFITFRNTYGISYSLLGLLVLINFFTQLIIDLIFSFFSHKFNVPKTVKFMPLLAIIGLMVYAVWPTFSPATAYIGLFIGTILFSVAAGLGEVLISPIIAAIPAENPDREMSKLHSIFAWGVVFVVLVSTLYLNIAGHNNWYYLPILFSLIPLSSFILYRSKDIPQMSSPEKSSDAIKFLKNKTVWCCVGAIFFGGAAECTMSQWCSGYLEQALGINKVWGDIFGVALFAVMLGLGRTLYAKFGKNISRVLFLGALGAAVCYITVSLCPIPVVCLFACAFTGFCASMLWPGCLIVASDRFPKGGVLIFALMAAGGDLGASVGPQLIGIVADATLSNPFFINFANSLQLAPDQLGLKIGLLIATLFPILSLPIYNSFRKKGK